MTSNNGKPSNSSDESQQLNDVDRLRELIGKAGLSQRGAARELGVDDRTMRYWCSGDQIPPRMVMRAMDPVTRHRENLRRTIANNRQVIESIESERMTGLGYGGGPANAGSAAAEAQRLRRQNEELEALLRVEEAFERRQQVFFTLIRGGTDEDIEEARAADQAWRAAQQDFDRIGQEIRAGLRR